MLSLSCDVAVIGGGPAGLAAAIEAKSAGAKRVLILEREAEIGGILQQCIHPGFGLHIFRQELTGPEYAQRFIERVYGLGIEVKAGTMVLGIQADKTIYAVNTHDGVVVIHPKAVVLAMGCRERTRGAIAIAGTRPAGIYTAGTAQRLMNMEGYLPGRKVVILGSGDVGLIMARRLTLEGAQVLVVLEALPYPGGLVRNVVQCLDDYEIPLMLSHTVVQIHGSQRVEGVTIAQVGVDRRPILGTERQIACDTLLLSVGLIPENELSPFCGVELAEVTGGPVVNEQMETSVPGVFACGNVVHVHDLVDNVTREAQTAGRAAALSIQSLVRTNRSELVVKPGEGVRYVLPQRISLSCPDGLGREKVPLFLRVTQPGSEVLIKLASADSEVDFYSKVYPRVRPGEMIEVPLNLAKLEGLSQGQELIVTATGIGTEVSIEPAKSKGARTLTCTVCPVGCEISIGEQGASSGIEGLLIEGYRCKRGKVYAEEELKSPQRVLTTTVRVKNGTLDLVPVRTTKPVPKGLLQSMMRELANLIIEAPLSVNQIICSDILGTGADLVATRDLPRKVQLLEGGDEHSG